MIGASHITCPAPEQVQGVSQCWESAHVGKQGEVSLLEFDEDLDNVFDVGDPRRRFDRSEGLLEHLIAADHATELHAEQASAHYRRIAEMSKITMTGWSFNE